MNDFFFISAEVPRKISIVTAREKLGATVSIKVSVSSVQVFCLLFFFPSLGSP